MRLKAEFYQIIDRKPFINQKGKIQFIFYDYAPFVGAIDYFLFHTKKDSKYHNSLGFSLSYLF